jgi:hypothetical protein
MKASKLILVALFPTFVLACAYQHPVFQDTGDREEAPEIPCANHMNTGYVVGWHRCHQKDPQGKMGENGAYNCCGDGFSCGEDDFMPSKTHICRWRGMSEVPQN